jgi:DNA-binding transcriptional MerR regulator
MELLQSVTNVAKILNVAPSTLKKYYLLFEEEGFRFQRSAEGHVLFSPHDVELLKKLIILKNQPGMTLKKAIQQIVAEEGVTDSSVTTVTTDITVITNQVATVMTEMQELKSLVTQQNELLQQQQKYIDERLKERDKKLVTSLRLAQEERRLFLQEVAAVIEEQQKKKSFWSRLLGK